MAVEDLKQRLSSLRTDAFEILHGKSLFLTREWSREALVALIELAELFEALDRRHIRTPLLPQELAYGLLASPCPRVASAWAGAAARLGMQAHCGPGSLERAAGTGALLGMHAHALGIRGTETARLRVAQQSIRDYLHTTRDPRQVPVVNLGSPDDHPTQCLGDLLWLREHFGGELRGRRVALAWTPAPGAERSPAVPQGLLGLLPRFGMDVILAHPAERPLAPDALNAAREGALAGGGAFRRVETLDAACEGAHAVYPLAWGPPSASGLDAWTYDERRRELTADALCLRLPGDAPAFSQQVARQANKGLYLIMALLAGAKVRGLWDRLNLLLD